MRFPDFLKNNWVTSMVGIDTSILVRYLTADDKVQYQTVLTFLCAESTVYIIPVVWVETVWVLSHCYHISVKRQCEKLAGLLDINTFVVDNSSAIMRARQIISGGMILLMRLSVISMPGNVTRHGLLTKGLPEWINFPV